MVSPVRLKKVPALKSPVLDVVGGKKTNESSSKLLLSGIVSSCGVNKTSNSISTRLLSLLLPGDGSGARIDVSVKELSGSTSSTIKLKRLSLSGGGDLEIDGSASQSPKLKSIISSLLLPEDDCGASIDDSVKETSGSTSSAIKLKPLLSSSPKSESLLLSGGGGGGGGGSPTTTNGNK